MEFKLGEEGGFPGDSDRKNLPAMQETWVRIPGQDDPLEKGMATHFSIFAWRFHGQKSLVRYSSWVAKSQTQLSN